MKGSAMTQATKVAIVTGAGSGIGKAVATAMLKAGYKVVLAGRRQELLAKAVQEAGATGDSALVVATDVANPESVRALFARTKAAFGRLDVLFNNAGVGAPPINKESISAHAPRPNSAPYTATKHAITGLTKSTSLDGRKYDIACSQIDIGNAATAMTARMASGVPQANGQIAPEPRLDLQHVVDAVLYMAGLPLEANVQFMTVMATKMPLVGRG